MPVLRARPDVTRNDLHPGDVVETKLGDDAAPDCILPERALCKRRRGLPVGKCAALWNLYIRTLLTRAELAVAVE